MIGKMFDNVSFSLETLTDQKAPSGYGDFEFLRDRPYFRFDEQLYCLDYEFAVTKLESKVYRRDVLTYAYERCKANGARYVWADSAYSANRQLSVGNTVNFSPRAGCAKRACPVR
jgi:hypothetical protein